MTRFTFLRTALGISLWLLPIPTLFAAPVNDNLTMAQVITKLPYTHQQSTQEATTTDDEIIPSCTTEAGASVWYQYVPTRDQVVVLDTFDSDYDTVLSLWSGKTHSLTELACNNNPLGTTATQVIFRLTANLPYYINISGVKGSSGKLNLQVYEWTAPSNNEIAKATVIPSLPFSQAQYTQGATIEVGETAESCVLSAGGSVWYQYVAKSDQTVIIDTNGSNYDTVLSVWSDNQLQLACNDNKGYAATGSQVTLTVTAGTTYYLKLSGVNGSNGTLVLNVNEFSRADNDDLAAAIVIPTLPYSQVQNTWVASQEEGEVTASCGGGGGNSVWYQYTPSYDQGLLLDTTGSDYDTVLSVWSGTTHPLTEIVCSDSPLVNLKLTANTTYYINISSYSPGIGGNLVLSALEIPSPPNDDLAMATVIPTLPYSQVQSTQGATQENHEIKEECGGLNSSVWYQYTPTHNQGLLLDANGSDYDTVLSVWIDSNHSLTEVACSSVSPLNLTFTANTTYYINISGYLGARGNLLLNVQEIISPSNDNLANALVIPALPYHHLQKTWRASQQEEEVQASCGGMNSVWYQYTPSHDQELLLDTTGSDYDTVLSVWSGTTHPLTEIVCSDSPLVTLKLTVGTTYYINISNFWWDESGFWWDHGDNLIFSALEIQPPPNDDLAMATVIPTLPYNTNLQTTLGTSQQPGEVTASCGGSGGNSVWYQYTPSHDQNFLLDTTGSDYDTVLSVWSGTTHPLTEIVCGSPLVTLKLTANTTYYINISSYSMGVGGNLVLSALEIQSPPNDDLATATVISTLPYSQVQNTWAASSEEGEINANCGGGGGNSVWYQYTPSHDQGLLLETTGSDYDGPVLSVWSGTTHPLTEIVCSDYPLVTLKLTANTTYYINISGSSPGVSGNLIFQAQEIQPPPNDDLATATVISTLPYSQAQNTWAARPEEGEVTASCGYGDGNSVWYQYTPSHDQNFLLDTTGSDYDAVLSVWSGTTHPLTEIVCSDYPLVTLKLTANTTYYIKISSYLMGVGGNLVLSALEIPSPPNDDLAMATVISTLPYSQAQNTWAASFKEGEINASCNGGGNSVWYQYTPSHDQGLLLDTVGSDYDTVLSVWSGTTHPLTEIVCSDSPLVSLKLTADDTTYYINISSYSMGGNLVLSAQEIQSPPNDDLAMATVISTLPYSQAQNTWAASLEEGEINASCGGGTGNSVWYQYTPSHDQGLLLDTVGSDYDTVLSVWSGTTHPLIEIVCSDSPLVSFKLTADTTYYINISSYSMGGNLVLSAQEIQSPPNDDLTMATVISMLPYSQAQNTWAASPEEGEINASCGYGGGNSVWYQYTPSHDQGLLLNIVGSDYNTVLSVWSGTTYPLTEIVCGFSLVSLKLTANTTYYINISSYSMGVGGNLVLSAQEIQSPPNDDLAMATVISTLPYNQVQNTWVASQQEGEVTASCGNGGNSVWYQYMPSQDQILRLDTTSDYGTVLSVWKGTTHPLTEIACAYPGSLSLRVTSSTMYYLNISGIDINSIGGNLMFNAHEVTPPSNDLLANAMTISTLPYRNAQTTSNATLEANEVVANCATLGGGSVWYQYTPSHDQVVLFGATSSDYYSPVLVLSVWSGTSHPLTQMACGQSQLSVTLTAGTTYYLNLSGGGNNLVLTANETMVTVPATPSNDKLAQAQVVTNLPYIKVQNTSRATFDEDDIEASCATSGTSVWYQYTPTTTQVVNLDSRGASYDTVISLWTGQAPSLTEIACQDDWGNNTLQAKLDVTLTADTTYFIQVSGARTPNFPLGETGQLVLQMTANSASKALLLTLPSLGQVSAIDAMGKVLEVSGEASGGISINGGDYQSQATLTLSETTEIWGKLTVDPNQVGQAADLVVYAAYKPSTAAQVESFIMLGKNGNILPWDENPSHLVAVESVTLVAEQGVKIYSGKMMVAGALQIVFGYRRPDGTLVTNEKSLEVTITE